MSGVADEPGSERERAKVRKSRGVGWGGWILRFGALAHKCMGVSRRGTY